jgi:hypothetical protein
MGARVGSIPTDKMARETKIDENIRNVVNSTYDKKMGLMLENGYVPPSPSVMTTYEESTETSQ